MTASASFAIASPVPVADATAADLALWTACQALADGRPDACLAALAHDALDLPAVHALRAAAHGAIAFAAGDIAGADAAFDAAHAIGAPLPVLLRECGRHFLRRGDGLRAHACYSLLEPMEPGALLEHWAGLSDADKCRHAPVAVPRMLHASPPRLGPLQPVKAAMVAAYGVDAAALVLAPMLRPGANATLRRLPVVSLEDHARTHALRFRELIAPREVAMHPPRVHAGARPRGIVGETRRVFACVLPDIVVASKSNLLLANDCVLMDFQGDERGRADINMDADPLVLAPDGEGLAVLDVAEASRLPALDCAYDLTGQHTSNYGHWIFEFLFPLWACLDEPGFTSVPLLIDAQMPAQLREALEFFAGPDHPIVVLGPGQSVRVRELWTCSRIAYWPGGERPGSSTSPATELADTAALAALLRTLAPRLDAVQPHPGQNPRIYLRRKPGQRRPMDNQDQVEQWFVDRGFESLDFGDLPFVEQVRRLRGADIVVGPDGAAFYGMVFARPGTRIGTLSQFHLEGYEWWSQMFADLGHRLLVLPGELHALNPAYRNQSGTRVRMDQLEGFLAKLESDTDGDDEPPPPPLHAAPIDRSAITAPGASAPAALDLARSTLAQACEHLRVGAPRRALDLLASHDDTGPVTQAITAVAQGELARVAGDAAAARGHFLAAHALGVPLAVLLRRIGLYFRAEGDDVARAWECYSLLEALEPGALFELMRALPATEAVRRAPAILATYLRRTQPLFYHLQPLKADLVRLCGDLGAAMVLAPTLAPGSEWRLRRLPVDGLQDYARAHALAFTDVVPPQDVEMAPPPLFGRPPAPGFRGRSRRVFVAVLPQVTVLGKSNLLLAADRLLLDRQGSEGERIALNFDTNPAVLVAADGGVGVIEHGPPARRPGLPRALALVGLHSYNFGHWVVEFLFQLWACQREPGFADVPIVVDAQMPPQLRELLEVFAGPGHPVVVLQPGESVTVEALWTCSKVSYWPGGERLPAPPSHDYELSDTQALVERLVAPLQERLETFAAPGTPERIYLTRTPAQGRPLVNRAEVEALFAANGFAVFDFTKLPMHHQLTLLRGANTVVMEAGSAMYGALFCRPGTRIGELADDDTAEHEWCAGMFRALGMPLLLFPCDTIGPRPGFTGAIDKRADLAQLATYLQALAAMPMPTAARRHPDSSGATP